MTFHLVTLDKLSQLNVIASTRIYNLLEVISDMHVLSEQATMLKTQCCFLNKMCYTCSLVTLQRRVSSMVTQLKIHNIYMNSFQVIKRIVLDY